MARKNLILLSLLFVFSVICLAFVPFERAYAATSVEYAVALSEYDVDNYDLSVSVYAPDGSIVKTENGKFILSRLGTYRIFKNGKEIKNVEVVYKSFDTSFVYSSELPSDVKTNQKVEIPLANIYSEDQSFDEYSVSITKDNDIIEEFTEVNKSFDYKFSVSGEYNIVYSVVDRFGFKITDVNHINVLKHKEIIGVNLDEECYVLNTIDFSDVQGFYEGKTYPVSIAIYNSDDEKQELSGLKFQPVKEGAHYAEFSCDFPDGTIMERIDFNVVVSEGSLFSNGKNITSIKLSENTESKKGVEIYANGAGSYVYYNRLVDSGALDKDDKLISFYVPYNEYSDVNDIRVSLIDANDVNNSISVYWRRSKSVGWEHLTYMLVEFNGYALGLNNESDMPTPRTVYGAIMTCSFLRDSVDFNIIYDKEENAIYSYRSEKVPRLKILDLDDAEMLKGYETWQGFSSDLIYVRIDFIDNVKSGIRIQSIGDMEFTQSGNDLLDNNYLKFNYRNDVLFGGENVLLKGYEGYKYNLPIPVISNDIFGDIDVDFKLSVKNGSQFTDSTDIVSDYCFTPSVAGEYKAVYGYYDLYGFYRIKEFSFEVYDTIPPSISVYGTNIVADIMSYCVMPNITVIGGTGNIDKTVIYKYNNRVVEPDEDGKIFLSEKGNIDIIVHAEDEIGVERNVNFYVIINNDKRIIDVEEIPLSYISGREYVLPDFTALDYSLTPKADGYYMTKSVLVDGVVVGEDLKFVCPSGVEQITISYYGGRGTAKEVRKDVVVKVIDNGIKNKITDESLKNLFELPQGVNGKLFEFGYAIDFDKDFSFSFANPLTARELDISVSVLQNLMRYESIYFELTDCGDETKQIFIELKNISNKSADFYVNGNYSALLAATAGTYTLGEYKNINYSKFTFSLYDYMSALFGEANKKLCDLSTFVSGKTYTGFDGGIVKIKVGVKNCETDSVLVINSLSNQNFTTYAIRNGYDRQGPTVSVLREFDRRYQFGDVLHIPSAVGYDVLQGKCEVSLKINLPDGSEMTFDNLKDGDNIVALTQYGNYRFLYEAYDYFGNYGYAEYNVVITDFIAPQITVSADIPTSVKLGDRILLNDFTAVDNVGVVIKAVYVKTPQSLLVAVSDYYTFSVKGNYSIIYYASDAVGNFCKSVYDLIVE